MRLLIDTHVLIWWFFHPDRLSARVAEAMSDDGSEIWVSAASFWEIAIKHKLGKLPQVAGFLADLSLISSNGFELLPISAAHAIRAGGLPLHHRDPFDRLLIAQALVENLTLVSIDSQFDHYGVPRLWQ